MKDALYSLRRDFEGLCLAHYAVVLGHLIALTRDPRQVQNLAQDTFLGAYRSLDRLRIGGDFGAYPRGIARNPFHKSLRGTSGIGSWRKIVLFRKAAQEAILLHGLQRHAVALRNAAAVPHQLRDL